MVRRGHNVFHWQSYFAGPFTITCLSVYRAIDLHCPAQFLAVPAFVVERFTRPKQINVEHGAEWIYLQFDVAWLIRISLEENFHDLLLPKVLIPPSHS